MAEKKFDAQVNYGWGLSLNMTGKAPAVAKRIFDTYADALAYANDVNDSAIEGLVLSVVADTDITKNGLYFVKQVATPAVEEQQDEEGNVIVEGVDAKQAILVKISTNADSQATADEVQELLNSEISARTESDKVLSGAISANTVAIEAVAEDLEELASANTEAHTALSEAISANTVAIEELASANTEAHTALSGAISANTAAIEVINNTISGIQDNFQALVDENNAVHAALSGEIDSNKTVLETLKIKDVKSDEKILAVDDNGMLSSTFTVDYVSSAHTIYFKGANNSDLGSVDTTDFVKDGMLQDVTIDKTGGKTELVFTWNVADETQSGVTKTTRLTVNDFLDGTELSNLQAAFDTHVASANTMHLSANDRANFDALIQNYSKSQLDEKFATINNALTANTESHATLSQEIASANTRIEAVAEDLSELASANTEAHTALSEAISANTVAIEAVAEDLSELASANTEAHTALSEAISANTVAIEELASANTEAHTALSEAISANTVAIEELVSANTEAHTALSGAISANTVAIEELVSANTEAHTALSGAIDTNAEAIEMLDAKVKENEEVVAAALVDLKATKVSSIVAEEGSNLVVNEVKDDNGISYTIGFQWLTF